MKPGPEPLSVTRALWWRSKGLTWPAIGRVLAKEQGRAAPYDGGSVQHAVDRAKKA